MKQKTKLCMLVVAIILCGTANVWADEVNYMFRQWNGNNAVDSEERTVTNPVAITSSTEAIGSVDGTWYVVNGKVTITSRVSVSGHAYIILADDCELICEKGITVMNGNELVVYGQTADNGLLKISSPIAGNAGLGGACGVNPDSDKTPEISRDCGTVTIHGGHLDVHGSAWSAGIGGGWMQGSCKVTILGGNVEAYGGEDAAGIGSGCFDQREEKAYLGFDTGWTKIYGGKVKAKGGDSGAGIGGGACRYVGKIEIFGGEVTANGGVLGAGIGGGSEMDGSAQSGGVEVENSGIYIYGGKVWANGGIYAAGIGGGFGADEYGNGSGSGNGGHIEIRGGTVWANGGSSAAGIGGSCYAGLRGLTITGGEIHALGGEYAAGIGAGEIEDGTYVSVIIQGGTVKAQGGEEGAGIGTGSCGKLITLNDYKVDVIISGGIVEATGGKKGAGIGGGNEYVKSGIFHMTGGTLVAKAGAGCNGEKPGEGSAIGCGYGVSNKGSDSKSGTFIIASSMMMIAGSSETDKRVFGYDERRDGCVWRSYIELKPCLEHDFSYVIVYGNKHAYRCRRCAYSSEAYHDYTNNGICVCGKREDSYEQQCKVTIYKKVDAFSTNYNTNPYNDVTNKNGYVEYDTEMNAEFTLPTCDIIASDYSGSYRFVGWMVAPTETPTSCMFYDTDKLYEEGRTIIIPHMSGVNIYARYMYEFSPKMVFDGDNLISDGWNWTWDENNKTYSATVTIENKALENEEFTPDVYEKTINAKIVKSDLQKGDDDKYYYHYYALANYDDVDFTDVREQELSNFVILENDNDNKQIIEYNIGGNKDNVYLEDRVLYKDKSWNTLCLPFDLSSFTGTPLEGATVKTLTSATIDNGTLTLNFSEDLTSIEAGQPYIVKWEDVPTPLEPYDGTNEDTTTDLYSPTFWEVGIKTATAGTVEGTAADFVGQFASKEFTEADNTVLFLGGGNTLYYPDAPMTIGAQRAYFQLKNGLTAGDSSSAVRSIVLNFGDEETGISSPDTPIMNGGDWYGLNGVKLNGKPTVKGVYIHNGRKVVIMK